jgi:RimJ/RimL family protein N-acetyltransferase
MNIQGKKITLKAIEEQDLILLHEWANDTQTQDIMGDIHFPSSMSFHKEWFDKLKNDKLNQRLAIHTPDLGLIGLSTIINIDWKNNHSWHGIFLGNKDIRGKGYGIDSVMATMRYAFDELHMERLDGSMIEYNETSINFYCNKLGWKKEGIRRNYYFRKGRYWDQVIVGITKEDYYQLIKENKYWDEKL